MFQYPNPSAFQDFYEVMQSIEEPHHASETKKPKSKKHSKKPKALGNINTIISTESLHGVKSLRIKTKKENTSSGFEENGLSCLMDAKPIKKYSEDQSTMASLSPLNSMESLSSMISVAAEQASEEKKSKVKAKGEKKKRKARRNDFKLKYKTEVCKLWLEHGTCKYGDQCAFAHGETEVREKAHISSNYKTIKCQKFHDEDYCPYGIRCQFIHCAQKDHNSSNFVDWSYATDIEKIDVWFTLDPDCLCMTRKSRPKLTCFKKYNELES